jgi:hypothetical protein
MLSTFAGFEFDTCGQHRRVPVDLDGFRLVEVRDEPSTAPPGPQDKARETFPARASPARGDEPETVDTAIEITSSDVHLAFPAHAGMNRALHGE